MNECRSCSAPIRWARTVPGGKRIPLDEQLVDPTTRGAYVVVDGKWAYRYDELIERILAKTTHPLDSEPCDPRAQAEQFIALTYTAHLAHFATCPNADQHRSAT